MASFQKYETKKGLQWLFKMDTGINPVTGKRSTTTRRGFQTKKEAQAAALLLQQELKSGVTINNNNHTYHEVFNDWYANHSKTIKASTKKAIESKFKTHILPRLGRLKIKEITKAYCQAMINDIAGSISSANDIKIQANQVFKYAIKMDIISKNPMEHVSVPRLQRELISKGGTGEERNFWKKTEIKHFLKLAKNELSQRDYVLFHLLIYTGARKGELLALSWDDIDLNCNTLRLWKTLFQVDGGYLLQTPKTKESKRIISLDTHTVTLLRKWRVSQAEDVLSGFSKKSPDMFIFTREDGSPLRLAYPNEKLNIMIKKHSLHQLTIHGLRHTHASLLFEAGASIKEVQERLGHSDIKMTMNIYTHVTDTVKEQTAEKFQQYLEL